MVTVGVISPYRAQLTAIREIMPKYLQVTTLQILATIVLNIEAKFEKEIIIVHFFSFLVFQLMHMNAF